MSHWERGFGREMKIPTQTESTDPEGIPPHHMVSEIDVNVKNLHSGHSCKQFP